MEMVEIRPMDASEFEPFGQLIDFNREPSYPINDGMCDRYHALATCEALGTEAQTVISLGRARPYKIPLTVKMMERHPFGSQAFIPLSPISFLVVVAADNGGHPHEPRAFLTKSGQGINYRTNVWHSVLTPLDEPADFLIVDRGGSDENLEECFLEHPFVCVFPH